MSIINWRNRNAVMPTFPNLLDNFFRDDDFLANRWNTEMTVPAVNVKETDTAFDIEVAAPGMKKEDFKVEVKNGTLYISAETEMEKEEVKEQFTRKEFSFSSFNRSFWLPENVKTENVKATYTDGILKIALPKVKVEKKEPVRMIQIN